MFPKGREQARVDQCHRLTVPHAVLPVAPLIAALAPCKPRQALGNPAIAVTVVSVVVVSVAVVAVVVVLQGERGGGGSARDIGLSPSGGTPTKGPLPKYPPPTSPPSLFSPLPMPLFPLPTTCVSVRFLSRSTRFALALFLSFLPL